MQPFDTPPPEPRYLTEPPFLHDAGHSAEPVGATSPRGPRRGVVVALAVLAVVGLAAAAVAMAARSSAQSDADAAETKSSRLAEDVAERDKTIDSLRGVVEGNHDEVARLEDQLDADESVIDEMKTRVDNVEADLAETEASLLAAEDQLARATDGQSDDPNTSASLPTANDGVISPMEAGLLNQIASGQADGLTLSIEEFSAIADRLCEAAGPWDVQAEMQDFADEYDVGFEASALLVGSIGGAACLDIMVTMVRS